MSYDIEFVKSTHTTAEIDAAVELVNTLRNQIILIQQEISSLQDSISSINNEISTLTTRVSTLESSVVTSSNVRHIVKITQSDYDQLDTPDESTQYNIV